MEIADLKARVESLERMVEKLTNPPPAVPKEAVFCPASRTGSLMIRLGRRVVTMLTTSWTLMGWGSLTRRHWGQGVMY